MEAGPQDLRTTSQTGAPSRRLSSRDKSEPRKQDRVSGLGRDNSERHWKNESYHSRFLLTNLSNDVNVKQDDDSKPNVYSMNTTCTSLL